MVTRWTYKYFLKNCLVTLKIRILDMRPPLYVPSEEFLCQIYDCNNAIQIFYSHEMGCMRFKYYSSFWSLQLLLLDYIMIMWIWIKAEQFILVLKEYFCMPHTYK